MFLRVALFEWNVNMLGRVFLRPSCERSASTDVLEISSRVARKPNLIVWFPSTL